MSEEDIAEGALVGEVTTRDEREGRGFKRFKTVKFDTAYKDRILQTLPLALKGMGYREARIDKRDFRILYDRNYPFSLEAFIATLGAYSIIVVAALSDESIRAIIFSFPTYSLLVALGGILTGLVAVIYGYVKKLELSSLRLTVGSKFLYMQFDITEGDSSMIQLLDEIGITPVTQRDA